VSFDALGQLPIAAQVARENEVHWTWLVYLEMFVAGIAAGAYVMAAILSLLGMGRSSLARAAHLIAFPLMAVAGILLIVDLERPERFWHMIVQSETLRPMFKWWSPMSAGSWGVLLFPLFAFVSFVDALIDRGLFHIGGWRRGHTLHGSTLGLIWSLIGAALAFFVAGYSGTLLNVSNIPGWADSQLISALYVATAAVTGLAAMLLVEPAGDRAARIGLGGVRGLVLGLVIWQMLLLAAFLVTLGPAARAFLAGLPLLAIVGAALLGGLLPIVLLSTGAGRRPALAAAVPLLILVGGFLVRYAVVMGPQHG
jgi:formate-dependent nitrite reductase membrane component NrfD